RRLPAAGGHPQPPRTPPPAGEHARGPAPTRPKPRPGRPRAPPPAGRRLPSPVERPAGVGGDGRRFAALAHRGQSRGAYRDALGRRALGVLEAAPERDVLGAPGPRLAREREPAGLIGGLQAGRDVRVAIL